MVTQEPGSVAPTRFFFFDEVFSLYSLIFCLQGFGPVFVFGKINAKYFTFLLQNACE